MSWFYNDDFTMPENTFTQVKNNFNTEERYLVTNWIYFLFKDIENNNLSAY